MRWGELFADLEAQMEAAERASFLADVQDLTRSERAGVELAARVMHAHGTTVAITTRDGETVHGIVVDSATQWILMGKTGPQTLVPVRAVVQIGGLGPRTAAVGDVSRKLGIGHVLRALARDRARVVVETGATAVQGLIGGVGADYVEVATGMEAMTLVPFDAIMRVRQAAA